MENILEDDIWNELYNKTKHVKDKNPLDFDYKLDEEYTQDQINNLYYILNNNEIPITHRKIKISDLNSNKKSNTNFKI